MRWITSLLVIGTVGAAHAATWNLSADWSDSQNPFGQWTLLRGDAVPFAINWNPWVAGYPQAAWSDQSWPQLRHVPMWAKATAGPSMGVDCAPTGIFMHGSEADRTGTSDSSVVWTSPVAGTVYLHGSIWAARHLGRPMSWSIRKNGVALSSYTFGVLDNSSEANPVYYWQGSGGFPATELSVVPGDTIAVLIHSNTAAGDFVGMKLCISTTQDPPNLSALVFVEDYDGNRNQVPITVTIEKLDGTPVQTNTIFWNGEGPSLLMACLEGEYRVCAKASHWLRRCEIVDFSSSNPSVSFSLLNGDVDGDNEVSIGDYAQLSAAFNSSPGGGNWNAEADLNGDEGVDIGDFAILSQNFGEMGD